MPSLVMGEAVDGWQREQIDLCLVDDRVWLVVPAVLSCPFVCFSSIELQAGSYEEHPSERRA